MRERPIPFSAPMVRAILSGTKVQTRRAFNDKANWHILEGHGDLSICPYGQPGDRLWVREAWRTEPRFNLMPPRDLDPNVTPMQYEAGPHADVLGGKLRPSMFMPRWASRITLEVTSVRVERLQNISEADAAAEGGRRVGPRRVRRRQPLRPYVGRLL